MIQPFSHPFLQKQSESVLKSRPTILHQLFHIRCVKLAIQTHKRLENQKVYNVKVLQHFKTYNFVTYQILKFKTLL